MAHIRSDLEGVVVVQGKSGLSRPITLRAGDKVPKGITVGDHLTGPAPRPSRSRQQAPSKPATPANEEEAGDKGAAQPASDEQEQQDSDQQSTEQPSTPSAATADAADGGSAEESDQGPALQRPPASGPGSDKGAWRRYAQQLGIKLADDASRADIQSAVEAHDQAQA